MLNALKKCLKNEKRDKTLFDAILFGSAVKGRYKPRDVDIILIHTSGSLAERLDKLQAVKEKIRAALEGVELDAHTVLLHQLFEPAFFARSGVFLEGISLLDGKPLSHKMGFKAYSLFTYTLEKLSHTKKVTFNYLLAGRGTLKGIIAECHGERLVSGAVKIPIEKSIEFEDVLKMHKINYKKKNILEEL